MAENPSSSTSPRCLRYSALSYRSHTDGVTERIGRTSITYRFTVFRAEVELARGQITAVLCRILDDHTLEPFPFPDELRERILAGPASDAG